MILDGWQRHEAASGASPATIAMRTYWLLRAEPHLPDQPVTADLEAFMASGGWSRNTLRSVRGALRSYFRWAHAAGLVEADPAAGLPRVRPVAGVPRPVPEHVYLSALAVAAPREWLMLSLAGRCGLRRGEIARVRGEDVLDVGLLVHGKGGRRRLVPLPVDVRAALVVAGDGWVFPGRFDDGHMHVDAVGKAMRRALGYVSSAHPCRHRFATRAYAGTHDLRAVQQLLGHASPATTQVYVQVDDDALRAAVAAAA